MFNKILELLTNIKSGPDNKGIKTFKITNYDALGDTPRLQNSFIMQTLSCKSLK